MFDRIARLVASGIAGLALCGLALAALAGAAAAEPRRMALVVGNSAYENLPELPGPADTARAVSTALRDQGFEVTVLTDVGSEVFQVVLETFVRQSEGADLVMFYYAGHGFTLEGADRLVPVSARLTAPQALTAETWSVDEIAAALNGVGAARLIVLDAARAGSAPAAVRGPSVAEGLAAPVPGAGSMVILSAAPGAVLPDGPDAFTGALLSRLGAAPADLEAALRGLTAEVEAATKGKQSPAVLGALGAPADTGLPVFEVVAGETTLEPPPGAVAAAADPAALAVAGGVGLAAAISSEGAAAPVRRNGYFTGTAEVPATEDDLHRAIQTELKRIGCYRGAVDGDWGRGSAAALERFYAAKRIVPAQVAGGVFAPTESAWRTLLGAPEETCKPAPAAVPVRKKPVAEAKPTQKKPQQAAKPAPAPAAAAEPKKKGTKCQFFLVAIVCS